MTMEGQVKGKGERASCCGITAMIFKGQLTDGSGQAHL